MCFEQTYCNYSQLYLTLLNNIFIAHIVKIMQAFNGEILPTMSAL